MPVPIPAFKWVCPQCHWSKTVVPKSDVLMRSEWPQICPACGCSDLKRGELSILEKILVGVLR